MRITINKKEAKDTGIGFAGALTLIFITLKLCKVITWSWWWVLAPIWLSALLAFGIFGIVMLIIAIAENR